MENGIEKEGWETILQYLWLKEAEVTDVFAVLILFIGQRSRQRWHKPSLSALQTLYHSRKEQFIFYGKQQ